MTYEQRLLAQALLATGLSNGGYAKAVSIMSLESVLAIMEKESGRVFNPGLLNRFTRIIRQAAVDVHAQHRRALHRDQAVRAEAPVAPARLPGRAVFRSGHGAVFAGR